MPGEPTPSVVSVNLGSGDRHSDTFTYTSSDKTQFMVAYSDRRIGVPRTSTDEELYDKVLRGVLIATDGKLVRESAVMLDGIRGREVVIERADGTVLTERFFLTDERMYQVLAEFKKSESSSPDVRRFLDSFRLTR